MEQKFEKPKEYGFKKISNRDPMGVRLSEGTVFLHPKRNQTDRVYCAVDNSKQVLFVGFEYFWTLQKARRMARSSPVTVYSMACDEWLSWYSNSTQDTVEGWLSWCSNSTQDTASELGYLLKAPENLIWDDVVGGTHVYRGGPDKRPGFSNRAVYALGALVMGYLGVVSLAQMGFLGVSLAGGSAAPFAALGVVLSYLGPGGGLAFAVGALWIAALLGMVAIDTHFLPDQAERIAHEANYYHERCAVAQEVELLSIRRGDRDDIGFLWRQEREEREKPTRYLLAPFLLWIADRYNKYAHCCGKKGGRQMVFFTCKAMPRLYAVPFWAITGPGVLLITYLHMNNGYRSGKAWAHVFLGLLVLLVLIIGFALEAVLNPFRCVLQVVRLCEDVLMQLLGYGGCYFVGTPEGLRSKNSWPVWLRFNERCWDYTPKEYEALNTPVEHNSRVVRFLRKMVGWVFFVIKLPLYFGEAFLDGIYHGGVRMCYSVYTYFFNNEDSCGDDAEESDAFIKITPERTFEQSLSERLYYWFIDSPPPPTKECFESVDPLLEI